MNKKKNQIIYLVILLCVMVGAIFILIKIEKIGESASSDNISKESEVTEICKINFSENEITTTDVSKAVQDGKQIIIGKSGNYNISGGCSDGQILINTKDLEPVNIVFDSLSLTCTDSAPLYVKNAKQVNLLITGENNLTDGKEYNLEKNETKPNACIYSKKDLTILGNGILNIQANYYNGISVRADFYMKSGQIFVNAVNNAIDAKNSVMIEGGSIKLTAGKDGISVKNKEDSSKGDVQIIGGQVLIQSMDDGIQSVNSISVKKGKVEIESQGQMFHCDGNIDVDSDCVTAK